MCAHEGEWGGGRGGTKTPKSNIKSLKNIENKTTKCTLKIRNGMIRHAFVHLADCNI